MPALEEVTKAIYQGKIKAKERRKARELKEREEAIKAEEGKFDGLVKLLR